MLSRYDNISENENMRNGVPIHIKAKKGVELFSEVPSANKWIVTKRNLSNSEWREMLKMNAMVPPIQSIPGHFANKTRCRHCIEIETLSPVLGLIPQGEL